MVAIRIDPDVTRYYLSLVPAMPRVELHATVIGAAAGAPDAFAWDFALDYAGFLPVPGGRSRNVIPKRHPAIPAMRGNPVVVPFATLMCGRLTVTVRAVIGGQQVTATRNDILIGGANPTAADLVTAVPGQLIRKLIQQESGGKQFSDSVGSAWSAHAVNPNWSSDNLRGVGLGQLTNPPPEDSDIWNWRSNARNLQQRFQGKRRSAATLHTRIAASARFRAEAQALNAWRQAEGLQPLDIRLPSLTADQQDNEGLRAYNGFGRKVAGEYLDYIHEYEPRTTVLTSATRKGRDGRPLTSPRVPDVDATGLGSWSQVSGAERRRRSGGTAPGDPDYVAHVLAQRG
jgi:hypothetical protein